MLHKKTVLNFWFEIEIEHIWSDLKNKWNFYLSRTNDEAQKQHVRQAKLPDPTLRHGKQTPEIRADFTHLRRVRDNHEAVKFAEHVKNTTRKLV